MTLTTDRTVLRPFREEDAAALYAFSRLHEVADAAGWPPHKSVEDSLRVIRTVFASPHIFAVTDRETGVLLGSAGFTGRTRGGFGPDDEMGYSLDPRWWGRGIMTEVCRCLIHYGCEEMNLSAIWCTHYDGNDRSRRVMEKCGFQKVFSETLEDDLGAHLTHFYLLLRPAAGEEEPWRNT